MKTKTLILIMLTISSEMLFSDGFLKTSGKKIVNSKNEEIFLRGMGLGGWMLPEGYMLHTSSFASAFWEMKLKIIDVVGEQNANLFWNEYRKNFVTRKDIERIRELGFNSVRLAMHYEYFINYTPTSYVWIDEGFKIVDSLLQQCADNKIYLILDLHAAPGGQSANNISDYNPALLSIWDSEKNKTMTIELWRKLAERYKNAEWIGGYDLLNEPAWNLGTNNIPLKKLYVDISNAIRSVDTNHILFIEGNWYATDFSGLTPPWDKNLVYSFHKYWNTNDIGAINNYLSLRSNLNVPLWLGESGENSNVWFNDCIKLMEENNIGWAWWTLKKFETIAGPFSVPINNEYRNLLNYWNGQSSKPSVENAMKGLLGMADGLKLEKIIYRPDVIDAMFRQIKSVNLLSYKENKIPGIIFATNYDLGKHMIAYKDADYQNIGNGNWNTGGEYRNDGVDIEKCSDQISNGYNVGWISNLENLHFTINANSNAKYSIDLRYSANSEGGTIGLSIDGATQIIKTLPKTDGWQNWSTINITDIDLIEGQHKIKLFFYFGGFNINYLEFKNIGIMGLNNNKYVPKKYLLSQNYPNPFNPSTTIRFGLPVELNVRLEIYNSLGQLVQTLVNEVMSAHYYEVKWEARKNPTGLYFYKIIATDINNPNNKLIQTKKMMLVK